MVYNADITYGTANEFGFDFLRDRIRSADSSGQSSRITRGQHYAIVDEADSILIDEAGTPLVIGIGSSNDQRVLACHEWAERHAGKFEELEHFLRDPVGGDLFLNRQGERLLRELPQDKTTASISLLKLRRYLLNAIRAHHDFVADKAYAVRDGEVVIIDEFTGRPAEGRQWQKGIHQAIQAKEQVEITAPTCQAAQITIQSFFQRYQTFCGMTGTAWTSKKEFASVFGKAVKRIPTHRPVNRTEFDCRVFASWNEKRLAIAEEAMQMIEAGRPVLIGTRSVAASERLEKYILELGLDCRLLNANHLGSEAEIVAEAGRSPRVTIATNMAGRGTDVSLSDDTRKAGGLHVILSEIHESERIDLQLIGRSARQGDPGSFRIFVCLEDEILSGGLGPRRAKQLTARHGHEPPQRLARLFKYFVRAQQRVERRNLTDRLILLQRDQQRTESCIDTGRDPYLTTVN